MPRHAAYRIETIEDMEREVKELHREAVREKIHGSNFSMLRAGGAEEALGKVLKMIDNYRKYWGKEKE